MQDLIGKRVSWEGQDQNKKDIRLIGTVKLVDKNMIYISDATPFWQSDDNGECNDVVVNTYCSTFRGFTIHTE